MTDAITYDDVLLVPSYNHWESRRVVDISVTDKSGRLRLDLPIMTSNMDTITESEMANYIGEKGGIGVLHRFMSIEENIRMFKRCEGRAFVSIGCTDEDLERTEALRDAGADYFCVDVAHAHARYVGKTLSRRQALTCDVPKRRRESEVAERGGVHKVISECPALLPACRGLG